MVAEQRGDLGGDAAGGYSGGPERPVEAGFGAGIEADAESPLAVALAERDREVMQMVREAVATRAVRMAFQPVVQAGATDNIAFHEGLIRLLDRSGRIIPARDFIETVETTELGRQIDCLALELGLRTLQQNPGIRLSVNMSARSIGYGAWLDTLRRGLAGAPTLGERLILEITESSAMGMPELVGAFMRDLQVQGVAFALDDFGAGFTSFRYLREFLFDIVKIDGQFIRGIAEDEDNKVLVSALVTIARHFDMFTVAESVEGAVDAEFCTGLGVTCLQGYHFGAPTLRPVWDQTSRLTA